ncbi:MAG: DMT family transporter [Deinococcales bacterium]
MTPSLSLKPQLNQQTTAALLVMLLVDSFHLIFARMLAPLMSPFSSSFYVLTLATLQIALYATFTKRLDWQILKKHFSFFSTIGFLIAAATICSYTSVRFIDAGTASLLGRISTVITLALSYFWLKEKLTPRELMGALLCILGAFVISFQSSNVLRLGSLFVLGSVSFYALHIAVVKRYGEGIEFVNFFLWRLSMTAFFLALSMSLTGHLSLPPSGYAWFILTLTAVVDVLISRVLYYWALRKMRLGIHTIVLTLTPVLTVLWSVIFFDESPSWQSFWGGILVLGGIMIVVLAQRKRNLKT